MSEPENNPSEREPRPALPPIERAQAAADRQQDGPAFEPHVPRPEAGNWFHRNRWFTKEPLSYTGYQFARSALAAIPYGPAMALGHHLFGLMSVQGQKWGLTQAGIDVVNKDKNIAGLEKAAASSAQEAAKLYKTGTKAVVGRNMVRLAHSPMNAAVQIGMGFTLFRFTGGLVKNLRDRIMNENNTPQDTARETHNAFSTIGETAKNNWPAESTGTPIAALVLGFMNAAFTPVANMTRDKAKYPGLKGYAKQVGEAWGPKSKLLQNGAVWTLSYSLFFVMAESLFKDVQIRRGLWKGHPNSLKNGPDDTVGGPGAPDYRAPEEAELFASAEHGHHHHKKDDDKATAIHHKLRYPALSGEPSLGRFAFRRVLPVAVGITGYAMMKRAGYLAIGGPMKPLTVEAHQGLKTLGDHAKFYGTNALREGAATSTFGVLWMATDAWGSWYDKFVHRLQEPTTHEQVKPLNAHQQAQHHALYEKLEAREQSSGRAA